MIERVPVSDVFAENAYFYIDPQTREAFLIDPGAEAPMLAQYIIRNNIKLQAILLTHGHFDHTGAVAELHRQFGVPYYISTPGEAYLTNPSLNLSAECNRHVVLTEAKFFNDGDILALPNSEGCQLQVIAAPGHTPDSVLLYDRKNNAAFVGDTIFKGSSGTSQFPGGNQRDLYDSIFNKVLTLPDNTILYSGHSLPTTVGEEKPNYMEY